MSDYDHDHGHGHHGHHDSHNRSWSPDRYSGGARRPSPGSPQMEPHVPLYPPPNPAMYYSAPRGSNGPLQVPPYPPHHHRPRSVPPHNPNSGTLLRRRSSAGYPSDSEPDSASSTHRPHSPLSKAKHVLEHSFSSSTSGLGVGVLGAIVGGLAAREASGAASKKGGHHGHGGGGKNDKGALISTIVGAAVGGLGANAIEKRLEASRKKTKGEQEAWEKKWGKESGNERERERERDLEEGRGRRYESGEDSEWEDERRRRRRSYERGRDRH
ncbi:hypothetical protein B0T14DRAFT_591474 [Immersiella caudata]|uniref:Glycine zipper 2TM domain-containing protein n=1 Tax=Immersiella caudata TaxID=314043 RepID=A0AA39WDX9_9PEZI|nr:hypothetical protein B0T14DRAFT_591474 [Immersiella caudata]